MPKKTFVGVIGLSIIVFIVGFVGGSIRSEHKLNRALINRAEEHRSYCEDFKGGDYFTLNSFPFCEITKLTEPVYYKTWCETRGGETIKDGDKELCFIKK